MNSEIDELKKEADDDEHPIHQKLLQCHFLQSEFTDEDRAQYVKYRKERGRLVIQRAMKSLLLANESFVVVQLLAKNLLVLASVGPLLANDEFFRDEAKFLNWFECSSLLKARAMDIIAWILALKLPAYGNIDWTKLTELQAKVSSAQKIDATLMDEIMAWVRILSDVPKPDPSLQTSALSLAGGEGVHVPIENEGYFHNFKEVFEFLKFPYDESQQRRFSNLSRMTDGPLHSTGKGRKKVLIPKSAVCAWWARIETNYSQRVENAEKMHKEHRARTAHALDVTSRSAHSRNQKEILLSPEDGLSSKFKRKT